MSRAARRRHRNRRVYVRAVAYAQTVLDSPYLTPGYLMITTHDYHAIRVRIRGDRVLLLGREVPRAAFLAAVDSCWRTTQRNAIPTRIAHALAHALLTTMRTGGQ